jgi:hypothetical protein
VRGHDTAASGARVAAAAAGAVASAA